MCSILLVLPCSFLSTIVTCVIVFSCLPVSIVTSVMSVCSVFLAFSLLLCGYFVSFPSDCFMQISVWLFAMDVNCLFVGLCSVQFTMGVSVCLVVWLISLIVSIVYVVSLCESHTEIPRWGSHRDLFQLVWFFSFAYFASLYFVVVCAFVVIRFVFVSTFYVSFSPLFCVFCLCLCPYLCFLLISVFPFFYFFFAFFL